MPATEVELVVPAPTAAAAPRRGAAESPGGEIPVPGPRGRRLLGSLLDVRRDRIAFVSRALAEHGDLVAFRMGPKRLYLLSHPDHFRHVLSEHPHAYTKGVGLEESKPLLGEGLLTSSGERAAAQRRHLQGAFRTEVVHGYADAMVAATEEMLATWPATLAAGRPLDVAGEMTHLTLDILGSTLLGIDLRTPAERVTADLGRLSRWAMRRMTALVRLPLSLPTPSNLRARRALRRLERLARESLAAARSRPAARPGVLLRLLDEPGDAPRWSEVRDEFLTFLLAGHETTAATLAWTFHLLSTHPGVDAALREELTAELGGRAPSLADLGRLPYTRAVVEEAMRLYPPVWMIPRVAAVADRIAGVAIPAGADVLLCTYTLHRHPDFWPEPERFLPQRFLAEGSARGTAAYLPFGSGPRSCLGSRFALLEATLVLATVAARYRFAPFPARPVAPDAQLTLQPRGGLPLMVFER